MCKKCNKTNKWTFCPYCGNKLRKEPQKDKTERMTQEKFDEIFLEMLRKPNRVVWINNTGEKSDIPTCNFDMLDDNGLWMFYISMNPTKPEFLFSSRQVGKVFMLQYGLKEVDIQRLMKNQMKLLFNMDGVTPKMLTNLYRL